MQKQKTGYVDGFVFIVPSKNLAAYKKMATAAKKIWMKHGAIDYKECVGEDLHPQSPDPSWNTPSFVDMAKMKKGETVWFSYITFKSRAHRDAVNKKVMKDPAMNNSDWKDKPMPVDMKRFSYGGFKVVIG